VDGEGKDLVTEPEPAVMVRCGAGGVVVAAGRGGMAKGPPAWVAFQ
jgi:hypothetical protein